jgi:hypothetical protein
MQIETQEFSPLIVHSPFSHAATNAIILPSDTGSHHPKAKSVATTTSWEAACKYMLLYSRYKTIMTSISKWLRGASSNPVGTGVVDNLMLIHQVFLPKF